MKLWIISQGENTYYDTYDSAVVAAETEAEAKAIHPDGIDPSKASEGMAIHLRRIWCEPEHVTVRYIGEADPSVAAGVVLASFNAG